MRKTNRSGPEIWLACQRSVATAEAVGRVLNGPTMSAPIVVYIGDSRNSDER